ncbi:MAG: flagellar protein FlbD [Acidimicrobiia bacterium]|nr:flagellar protein FlbD [Acidimicrobiia bacterium]
MIQVTRIDGAPFVLNADLIERVELLDDTVVTLLDGHQYSVRETPSAVVEAMVAFRASVMVMADHLQHRSSSEAPHLRLVTDSKER